MKLVTVHCVLVALMPLSVLSINFDIGDYKDVCFQTYAEAAVPDSRVNGIKFVSDYTHPSCEDDQMLELFLRNGDIDCTRDIITTDASDNTVDHLRTISGTMCNSVIVQKTSTQHIQVAYTNADPHDRAIENRKFNDSVIQNEFNFQDMGVSVTCKLYNYTYDSITKTESIEFGDANSTNIFLDSAMDYKDHGWEEYQKTVPKYDISVHSAAIDGDTATVVHHNTSFKNTLEGDTFSNTPSGSFLVTHQYYADESRIKKETVALMLDGNIFTSVKALTLYPGKILFGASNGVFKKSSKDLSDSYAEIGIFDTFEKSESEFFFRFPLKPPVRDEPDSERVEELIMKNDVPLNTKYRCSLTKTQHYFDHREHLVDLSIWEDVASQIGHPQLINRVYIAMLHQENALYGKMTLDVFVYAQPMVTNELTKYSIKEPHLWKIQSFDVPDYTNRHVYDRNVLNMSMMYTQKGLEVYLNTPHDCNQPNTPFVVSVDTILNTSLYSELPHKVIYDKDTQIDRSDLESGTLQVQDDSTILIPIDSIFVNVMQSMYFNKLVGTANLQSTTTTSSTTSSTTTATPTTAAPTKAPTLDFAYGDGGDVRPYCANDRDDSLPFSGYLNSVSIYGKQCYKLLEYDSKYSAEMKSQYIFRTNKILNPSVYGDFVAVSEDTYLTIEVPLNSVSINNPAFHAFYQITEYDEDQGFWQYNRKFEPHPENNPEDAKSNCVGCPQSSLDSTIHPIVLNFKLKLTPEKRYRLHVYLQDWTDGDISVMLSTRAPQDTTTSTSTTSSSTSTTSSSTSISATTTSTSISSTTTTSTSISSTTTSSISISSTTTSSISTSSTTPSDHFVYPSPDGYVTRQLTQLSTHNTLVPGHTYQFHANVIAFSGSFIPSLSVTVACSDSTVYIDRPEYLDFGYDPKDSSNADQLPISCLFHTTDVDCTGTFFIPYTATKTELESCVLFTYLSDTTLAEASVSYKINLNDLTDQNPTFSVNTIYVLFDDTDQSNTDVEPEYVYFIPPVRSDITVKDGSTLIPEDQKLKIFRSPEVMYGMKILPDDNAVPHTKALSVKYSTATFEISDSEKLIPVKGILTRGGNVIEGIEPGHNYKLIITGTYGDVSTQKVTLEMSFIVGSTVIVSVGALEIGGSTTSESKSVHFIVPKDAEENELFIKIGIISTSTDPSGHTFSFEIQDETESEIVTLSDGTSSQSFKKEYFKVSMASSISAEEIYFIPAIPSDQYLVEVFISDTPSTNTPFLQDYEFNSDKTSITSIKFTRRDPSSSQALTGQFNLSRSGLILTPNQPKVLKTQNFNIILENNHVYKVTPSTPLIGTDSSNVYGMLVTGPDLPVSRDYQITGNELILFVADASLINGISFVLHTHSGTSPTMVKITIEDITKDNSNYYSVQLSTSPLQQYAALIGPPSTDHYLYSTNSACEFVHVLDAESYVTFYIEAKVASDCTVSLTRPTQGGSGALRRRRSAIEVKSGQCGRYGAKYTITNGGYETCSFDNYTCDMFSSGSNIDVDTMSIVTKPGGRAVMLASDLVIVYHERSVVKDRNYQLNTCPTAAPSAPDSNRHRRSVATVFNSLRMASAILLTADANISNPNVTPNPTAAPTLQPTATSSGTHPVTSSSVSPSVDRVSVSDDDSDTHDIALIVGLSVPLGILGLLVIMYAIISVTRTGQCRRYTKDIGDGASDPLFVMNGMEL